MECQGPCGCCSQLILAQLSGKGQERSSKAKEEAELGFTRTFPRSLRAFPVYCRKFSFPSRLCPVVESPGCPVCVTTPPSTETIQTKKPKTNLDKNPKPAKKTPKNPQTNQKKPKNPMKNRNPAVFYGFFFLLVGHTEVQPVEGTGRGFPSLGTFPKSSHHFHPIPCCFRARKPRNPSRTS